MTDILAPIRERLANCPIPLSAQADYAGTNHFEITTSWRNAKEYWWLVGVDTLFSTPEDWSATETGQRLGAVLDYATHYKRDITDLLAEITRLKGLRGDVADPQIQIQCCCCGDPAIVPGVVVPVDDSGICLECQAELKKEMK